MAIFNSYVVFVQLSCCQGGRPCIRNSAERCCGRQNLPWRPMQRMATHRQSQEDIIRLWWLWTWWFTITIYHNTRMKMMKQWTTWVFSRGDWFTWTFQVSGIKTAFCTHQKMWKFCRKGSGHDSNWYTLNLLSTDSRGQNPCQSRVARVVPGMNRMGAPNSRQQDGPACKTEGMPNRSQ